MEHKQANTDVRKILHPTDFSEGAGEALNQAVEIGRLQRAEVHVLHVARTFGDDPVAGAFTAAVDETAFNKALRREAEEYMDRALSRVDVTGVTVHRVHARGDDASAAILAYAATHEIELIVMGTRGRTGLRHAFLGSVAEKVVRSATCPVLTQKTAFDSTVPLRGVRLLAPVDLSPSSLAAIRCALSIARLLKGEVVILHVLEPVALPVSLTDIRTIRDLIPDIDDRVTSRLNEAVSGLGPTNVPVSIHVVEGHAAATVVEFAADTDAHLIVLAKAGLSGYGRATIGSVAERIVRTATCPVLSIADVPASGADAAGVGN